MSTIEFVFSDLARRPAEVSAAAETHSRVLLRRRDAPDLELSRADARGSQLSQAEAFARLLAGFLPHVDPKDVPAIVVGVLPGTKYLTPGGGFDHRSMNGTAKSQSGTLVSVTGSLTR